jgi:DNA-binding GntR family transcriptional regulator
MNKEIKHKSRTAQSYEDLREAVVSAQYPPGTKLFIDQIGRELGVSAGAVREALSRLSADGLVVAKPQKGFVVAPISRKDLIDLTAVRVSVESQCLALSIENGDLAWEGRVLSAHHQLKSLGHAYRDGSSPEAQQWHTCHNAFHDQITSACENLWWQRLRKQLYIQSERYRRLSAPADHQQRDTVGEHAAIADAVLARDSAKAVSLMKDHLERTTDVLLETDLPFED